MAQIAGFDVSAIMGLIVAIIPLFFVMAFLSRIKNV